MTLSSVTRSLADEEIRSVASEGFSHTSYGEEVRTLNVFEKEEKSYENPVVAEKEQRAVLFARLVVLAVLLIALGAVTTTMYFLVSNQEKEEFNNQFASYASEISSLVQDNARSTVDAAEAFSTMITSYANLTNSQWPYVTIPDFTSKAMRLAKLTGAYHVSFAPIVYSEEVSSWMKYSSKNLNSYYTEAVEVSGYNTTSAQLVATTISFPWQINETGPLPVDIEEPVTPPQLVELRERLNFKGFWLSWQSQPWLQPFSDFFGVPTTNLELLRSGFEDAFATAYEFNIPSFDMYRTPVVDPAKGQIKRWDIQTQMVQPIFDRIYNGKTSRSELRMVAAVLLIFDWGAFLSNLLSKNDIRDVEIVLSSTCSVLARPVTYRVTGQGVVQVGPEDLHDKNYHDYDYTTSLFALDLDEETQYHVDEADGCVSEIIMSIYPTKELEESFYTNDASQFAGITAAIFAFTSFVFFVYDVTVRRRQSKVMARIIRQDKIVLNTFPKAIRDRLYSDKDKNNFSSGSQSADGTDETIFGTGPLAELYPSATVIFADIVGFTAWSSAREPYQVFKLLETVYRKFDQIAYHNSVFKVETVGDCYVAVAGVPEECENHAVAVAKFARECMHKMGDLTNKLEILLGPDTADLELRVGLNTGQVTAGVLRGDKARFQLFGDTVNTAARMESTSSKGRIQVSSTTADALKKAGREKWLTPRNETVFVKGKGQMQTYYLETKEESIQRFKFTKRRKKARSSSEMTPLTQETFLDEGLTEEGTEDNDEGDDISDNGRHRNMTKIERLVEWNIEVLSFLLKQILVARHEGDQRKEIEEELAKIEIGFWEGEENNQQTVLDEFQEIITLPTISAQELQNRRDPNSVTLSPVVISQLRDLLTKIAKMYRDNSFHNFEHASHVTASVRKLLTRIVDADHTVSGSKNPSKLVDISGHSYGITSDPLTQFSVVFSAVIHDADHPGVPNTQLVKENTKNAQIYKKSIAEQNSVDLVWRLLMSPIYDDLRACIYSNVEELRRFRQLVVNTVMATDIVDKELQTLRKMRWEKAFSSEVQVDSTPELDINRKATIVIEHLIQASDVSHTMQHWQVYLQWNRRFFLELYEAYRSGRAETDPSINWYMGEIGFFDYYIIPLAKKLENCGVFGVSSHEYLNYAQSNREQWVREGEKVVQGYLEGLSAGSLCSPSYHQR